jgi:hypothetical protein
MRYIDSGSRAPDQALGHWLRTELADVGQIAALRWQSGFYSAGALGLFAPVLGALTARNATAHLLVGANDGDTRLHDVAALLSCAGWPRPGLSVGVVHFANAFFHPKTVHITRLDGGSAAYVGSANLTAHGVASLHVEAGIVLDTDEGDDAAVLGAVADAVDRWFDAENPPAGSYPLTTDRDLDRLVAEGILHVAPRPASSPNVGSGDGRRSSGARLMPLVRLPAVPSAQPAGSPDGGGGSSPEVGARREPVARTSRAVRWQKALTRSDAQRKRAGNQRGSITLVGGTPRVDSQRFFRLDMFGDAAWEEQSTRTGRILQSAHIIFDVRIDSHDLGAHRLQVTYAPNREAGQSNYTTLLHIGSLSDWFTDIDLRGRMMIVVRGDDGRYSLLIA